MHSPKALLLLAVIPFTIAADCTASDSTPWPFGNSGGSSGGGSGGSGGSSTDACSQFQDDPAAYQACVDTAQTGQCNAVGCGGSSDSTGDLISNPGDDLISSGDSSDGGPIKKLMARATLTCTSSETCYQYTDDSLLCYNPATGDYHDDVGAKGNYFDGSYSMPSGAAASNTASATSNTPSATSQSGSTATPTSGGTVLRAGALLGALGLAVTLVL